MTALADSASEEAPTAPPATIEQMVAEVTPLLPEQAPLHAFVHHNTLHAFEHLPFERAVVDAAKILGTEPFMSEQAFAECLDSGRIRVADIAAVVDEDATIDDAPLWQDGPSRREFRRLRLGHLFPIARGQALCWQLEETELSVRFHPRVDAARRDALSARGAERSVLEELWRRLHEASPVGVPAPAPGPRRRDQLLALTDEDTDQLVHPLMIRITAAFLDQGVAYWSMPFRERGFLRAFRELYGLAMPAPDRHLRGLAEALRRQRDEEWSAEQTIAWAMERLGHERGEWPAVIRATLLSLRGWAGMMRHLEEHPDRAPVAAPRASIMDYLAVQLTLDQAAARNVLGDHLGGSKTLHEVPRLAERRSRQAREASMRDTERVFEAFVLAQLLPIDVQAFGDRKNACSWIDEVTAFDELERRRLLHLAYERRHRIEVLDGIVGHVRTARAEPPAPAFQATFCIDDREESLRRHLEECFPRVDTFGYAGFYGVAMRYQGLDDVHARPLCPVSIQPRHLVLERVAREGDEARYIRARRAQGRIAHSLTVGSKTLLRSGVLSTLVGLITMVPLVARSLFPRLTARWNDAWEQRLLAKPPTRLTVECEEPSEEGETQLGFTVAEMVTIVGGALRTMGLIRDFCPIVLIVGHGSSSLNNPHEAAHDCGATGGGRGGPNARAFAAMANRAEVRAALAEEDLVIPSASWFVGGYHNTCDDSMTYYDEDLVPDELTADLATVKRAMAEACELDAHERCRRFETGPADMRRSLALDFARVHANDLAEPRPEYGHATNAVCVVGRRARTRGLFLDRRAFLVSYDPTEDADGALLRSLLLSVGPVGAGINLEYYFSFVDPVGYGSGTKLPHNITGLLGVMDGHASDLRTGLPWQMVEIHEPVRLLNIVEAEPSLLERILAEEPALRQLVENAWIQLVAWDPSSDELHEFHQGAFRRYTPEASTIDVVEQSMAYYASRREHLAPAHIVAAFGGSK